MERPEKVGSPERPEKMVSVVTLANAQRRDRVVSQHEYLRGHRHGMVALELTMPPIPGVAQIGAVAGLELARARNLAGDWAARSEAETIIFLDADCIPGPGLIAAYEQAVADFPGEVITAPVTYLAQGQQHLEPNPHPARPLPEDGQTLTGYYDVFWSLSFALSGATWRQLRQQWGGFDESLRGYGGEDTDFGWNLQRHGTTLRWISGAHTFHRWHPVSSPPWEHREDIIRNAQQLYDKWGRWPMGGWLEAFAQAGAFCWPEDPPS